MFQRSLYTYIPENAFEKGYGAYQSVYRVPEKDHLRLQDLK
jgi:hypothetical protein